jgi:hypothetical protein
MQLQQAFQQQQMQATMMVLSGGGAAAAAMGSASPLGTPALQMQAAVMSANASMLGLTQGSSTAHNLGAAAALQRQGSGLAAGNSAAAVGFGGGGETHLLHVGLPPLGSMRSSSGGLIPGQGPHIPPP